MVLVLENADVRTGLVDLPEDTPAAVVEEASRAFGVRRLRPGKSPFFNAIKTERQSRVVGWVPAPKAEPASRRMALGRCSVAVVSVQGWMVIPGTG